MSKRYYKTLDAYDREYYTVQCLLYVIDNENVKLVK